jgi:hypothetical protein
MKFGVKNWVFALMVGNFILRTDTSGTVHQGTPDPSGVPYNKHISNQPNDHHLR